MDRKRNLDLSLNEIIINDKSKSKPNRRHYYERQERHERNYDNQHEKQEKDLKNRFKYEVRLEKQRKEVKFESKFEKPNGKLIKVSNLHKEMNNNDLRVSKISKKSLKIFKNPINPYENPYLPYNQLKSTRDYSQTMEK